MLRKYGPQIATPGNEGDTTFGHIAVNILNKVLRPCLAKWHPMLLGWEQKKPDDKTIIEHESEWEYNEELRDELNTIRKELIEYANVLGTVSGVADLIESQNDRKGE